MIPSSAIEAFLDRVLSDHRRLKKKKVAYLDEKLAAVRPRLKLYPKLDKHQKVMILLGVKYPKFNFFASMGSGKTLVSLTLLQYWWDAGVFERAMVNVISDKAYNTWERQRKQYGFTFPWLTLDAPTSEQKWQQLARFKSGVFMVAYPALTYMVTERVRKVRKGKVHDKNELAISKKKIAAMRESLHVVVWDEITRAAHRSSLTHKVAKLLSKDADVRYGLAGRPIGRNPEILWAQQYLVDRGKTLGATLGLFRAAFFEEKENRWDPKGWAKDYVFKKDMMPDLVEMMQHRSITYSEEECTDMPAFRSIIERVMLPEEARAYYQRCVKEIIAAKGNLIETKNAFMRMRQLSSGFLGFRDDETGSSAKVSLMENPKFERLMELLEEVPSDRQGVIFYDFTYSGRKIVEALKEQGVPVIWLWSGTKNPSKTQDRFFEGKAKFAVINNKVGAYSLDGLQCANYLFFYESPVPVIDRVQAERRLRRKGQRFTVMQYDMVCSNTMDERILEFHKEGEDINKALNARPKIILGDARRAG